MELLTVIRALRRHARLVLAGAGVAALIALWAAGMLPGASGSATQTVTGAALGRVLVDRPASLVADTEPDGADTAQYRAQLIADQMAERGTAALIARTAGLPLSQVVVNGPHVAAQVIGSPLSQRAAEVATAAAAPYVVGVNVAVDAPIVSIDTHTPDVASARRLVDAAVAALRVLAATTAEQGPSAVVIEPLGAPRTIAIPVGGGGHRKVALGAAVVLLAGWCFGVLVYDRLQRTRRRPATA